MTLPPAYGSFADAPADSQDYVRNNNAWAVASGGSGDLKADGTIPLTADWDLGGFALKNVGNIGAGIVTPLARLHARGASALRFDNGATDGFTVSQFNLNSWAWTGLSADSVMALQNASMLIGTTTFTAGILQVVQGATAAAAVLRLEQQDVSEDFVRLVGESHASDASQSLVDAANMTTPGAIIGWEKIYIEDTQSSGPITNGFAYRALYAVPTA